MVVAAVVVVMVVVERGEGEVVVGRGEGDVVVGRGKACGGGARGRGCGRPGLGQTDESGKAANGQVVGDRVGLEPPLHGEAGNESAHEDGQFGGAATGLAPTARAQLASWRAL